MKRITVLILSLIAIKMLLAQEYKLVFEENFEGNALSNFWNIEYNNTGGGNAESQYYTPRNVSIEKHASGASCLVLTAKRENYKGRPATSGRVNTANKMAVKYGKIDVRVKLPSTANGLWPAFWMMGDDRDSVGWPKCGEIDIIEVGHFDGIAQNKQKYYFNGAMHWGEGWNGGKYPNKATHGVAPDALDEGFQLFTLVWRPDSILMYLNQDIYPDVKPYFTMNIEPSDEYQHPSHYFHKPFHFLANLAVGGTFTGLPYYPRKWNLFPAWNKNFRKITALPKKGETAKMYIDYIRIYQNGTPGEEFYVR